MKNSFLKEQTLMLQLIANWAYLSESNNDVLNQLSKKALENQLKINKYFNLPNLDSIKADD